MTNANPWGQPPRWSKGIIGTNKWDHADLPWDKKKTKKKHPPTIIWTQSDWRMRWKWNGDSRLHRFRWDSQLTYNKNCQLELIKKTPKTNGLFLWQEGELFCDLSGAFQHCSENKYPFPSSFSFFSTSSSRPLSENCWELAAPCVFCFPRSACGNCRTLWARNWWGGGSKSCVVSAGYDERRNGKRQKVAAETVKKKKEKYIGDRSEINSWPKKVNQVFKRN